MRVKGLGPALVGALLLIGCGKDAGPFLPNYGPLAYTRFLNAVPDTFPTDWRFIDQVENSPYAIQMAFRGFTPYQGTGAGSRHLRVFSDPSSTSPFPSPEEVQKILADLTFTFEAGKYYTIVMHGNASPASPDPHIEIRVIEDQIPGTISGSQYMLRAINLGTTADLQTVDIYKVATTSTSIASLTPTFSGLGYKAEQAYTPFDTASMALRVTSAGSKTVITSVAAPNGADADAANNLTAIGGAREGQSAFTAFIVPRSVAGTKAPQSSAFQSATIVYIVDKHPPITF